MEPGPKKASAPSERESKIEGFASAVAEELKRHVAGKKFTVDSFAVKNYQETQKPIQITVVEDANNKGKALWDSQVPNSLFVREPGVDHGVVIFFYKLAETPEAKAMMSAIMREKNIPADMQAEIVKKITSKS
jgi:hypothetical protein